VVGKLATRVTLTLVLVGAALSAALVMAEDSDARKGKHPSRSCFKKGSSTIELNSDVRIYAISRRNGDDVTVYGCHRRTGRRTQLDSYCTDSIGCYAANRLWLVGKVVAVYDLLINGAVDFPTGPTTVISIDLATRKTRYRLEKVTFLSSLVLKRNGSFAAVTTESPLPGASKEVRKTDARGQATLDSGNIDPTSLALSGGSTFYWTKDGKPFSASLD
jgi:hypothetical protein